MEAAEQQRSKFAVCLGGNLFGSNPDAEYARRALAGLDLLVYLNTTLNTGHAHGLGKETLILPVLARDEEPEPTTQESMFSWVRLSDGGPARHVGPRSEIELIATLAERVLPPHEPVDWASMKSAANIRQAIAKIVPGMEEVAGIEQTKREFAIPGRAYHTPTFPTADGKAHFFTHEIPALSGAGTQQLRLMTIRSEGQFNTVVYEDYDLYRGVDRRDVILMHPDDLQKLGLQPDQPVCVKSEVGEIRGFLARAYSDIKPGNAAMYYPEANTVVPRHLDPLSKTPAFKNVLIDVTPLNTTKTYELRETIQPAANAKSSRDTMKSC
jgi:anaerobic selenocysteine-containing dehydrogenase